MKYMVTHIVGRSFNERLIIFGISIYSVIYSVRMKLQQNLFCEIYSIFTT
jgi:hypothetical protein